MSLGLRRFVRIGCVAAVAVSWAVPWLLLSFVLSFSQPPDASLVAPTIGLGGTVAAPLLCARALTRSRSRWWLAIAAAFGIASVALQYALLWTVGLVNHQLAGPTSPSGLTVIVDVRDAHPGLSADFYCDVRVLDGRGDVIAEWQDRGGQYPCDGPRILRDSMRWTSPTTLEFTTRFEGVERLTLP